MDIKDYENKVPEDIRKENSTKLSTYENEVVENEKSLAELKVLKASEKKA